MPERHKLLITGAAGRIGTYYRRHIGERCSLRLVDVKPIDNPAGHETLNLDLAEPEAAQQACAGMDTVLHLAADPRTEAEFYADLLDPNFKATYNIYRAAKDQSCQRVIFASSINAVAGYPQGHQIRESDSPCPLNVYGASKAFGESLGAYFATIEGLSVIAVRIGWVATLDKTRDAEPKMRSVFVNLPDLSQLFDRCIEAPDIRFAVVHGVSNNRFQRLDLTATRELLGYEPVDDAFSTG
jgi:nucleoside-diphosphate-sugar epimerase